MRLFGITGGIGMGKSTVGNLLLSQGYSLIDTDTIARKVVESGKPALREIQAVFGDQVISPTGELERGQLAKIVFSDPAALQKLESILHPRIREVWQAEVEQWRSHGASIGFVIIPLLFETGSSELFDTVISIACSESTQIQRLKARGWSDTQIKGRTSAQWSIDRKIAGSDYVVWTETNLKVVEAQLQRIVATTV